MVESLANKLPFTPQGFLECETLLRRVSAPSYHPPLPSSGFGLSVQRSHSAQEARLRADEVLKSFPKVLMTVCIFATGGTTIDAVNVRYTRCMIIVRAADVCVNGKRHKQAWESRKCTPTVDIHHDIHDSRRFVPSFFWNPTND